MGVKQEAIELMVLECNVCKHIAKKISKSQLNYRPSKAMRSTLELMRFISFFGVEAVRLVKLNSFATNNWDEYEKAAEKAKTLKVANFAKAMDAQAREIKKIVNSIPDADLKKKFTMPMGKPVTVAQALLQISARFIIGYRMQLYLYAKAGNPKLGTPNCWFGMDQPKPKKK